MTTVTRAGDRITKIRFKMEGDKPLHQYNVILAELPDDKAKWMWLAQKHDIRVGEDGFAEVRPL